MYPASLESFNWDHLGLLLRLSVAFVFLVGGAFAGMGQIPTFASAPWILFILGVLLASGTAVRDSGHAVIAVMVWFMLTKLDVDKSLIANLNGFKREFAFLAAGVIMGWLGGGRYYTLGEVRTKVKGLIGGRQRLTS